MTDAFETILVTWLAFAFLPERPTRAQGGTDGSNPVSSSGESRANLISSIRALKFAERDGVTRRYAVGAAGLAGRAVKNRSCGTRLIAVC